MHRKTGNPLVHLVHQRLLHTVHLRYWQQRSLYLVGGDLWVMGGGTSVLSQTCYGEKSRF